MEEVRQDHGAPDETEAHNSIAQSGARVVHEEHGVGLGAVAADRTALASQSKGTQSSPEAVRPRRRQALGTIGSPSTGLLWPACGAHRTVIRPSGEDEGRLHTMPRHGGGALSRVIHVSSTRM